MTTIREDVVHELTIDGRERHWFQKDGGVWCCPCGEQRDAHGATIPSIFGQK